MKINRFHSFTFATALAVVSVIAIPALTHAQMFVNGSFENPAEAANSLTDVTGASATNNLLPGWTGDSITGEHEYIINGNIEDTYGRDFGTPTYGAQYLGLNAVYRNSFHSIESQIVTGFTPGQLYELTFYIANLDGAGDPNIYATASANSGTGTLLNGVTFTAPVEGPMYNSPIDFVKETMDFVPTTSTVSFSFNNQSKQGVMGLDNFSVAAVPEPATLTLAACGGLGLLGAAARRLRKARA